MSLVWILPKLWASDLDFRSFENFGSLEPHEECLLSLELAKRCVSASDEGLDDGSKDEELG